MILNKKKRKKKKNNNNNNNQGVFLELLVAANKVYHAFWKIITRIIL